MKTLDEFLKMCFWEVLGLQRGEADPAVIQRAFRKMSLRYHPDKGGDTTTFVFLSMVAEVLGNPQKRRLYEAFGGAPFTEPFQNAAPQNAAPQNAAPQKPHPTPTPPINRAFLEKLLDMQGTYTLKIGGRPMVDHILTILAQETPAEVNYTECKLAHELGEKLRLVPEKGNFPIYSMARVIRFACFTGVNLVELDFPASHGQQLHKYAKKHQIHSPTLEEAFGSTECVEAFRSKPEHGVPPSEVKRICNMISYGAGRGLLGELPPGLRELKNEVARLRKHMWDNCPEKWKVAFKGRKHPELTLCSVHCQLGERVDLDVVVADLGVNIHGFLGDSALVNDSLDHKAFIEHMAGKGVHITTKQFPKTAEEYFEWLSASGVPFSQSALTPRQRRRLQAVKYAAKWMEDEERRGGMPHLEFAIAIEEHLPTAYNPVTKKTEFYNADDGVWYADGGQLVSKGEVLSEALLQVFAPTRWTHAKDEDGKVHIRLETGDVPMFHNGRTLGSIGEMCKHLRFDTSLPVLDRTAHAHKLVNFQGQFVLDFSVPRPTLDWENDEDLTKALALPLRESSISDRTTRSVPKPFAEYTHKGRLELARAIRAAMLDLKENDVLSDEVKNRLAEVVPQHEMMQHCFYEAHVDWDSALMQSRFIFEPCSDTGVRCQVATMKDNGDGSTAKGTLRELCEESLGTYNGEVQLGYSCVLKQETIQTNDREAPSEQTSNMYLCKHAWVDDFKPSKPLCTAVLRQLSGGNNITAARKHGRENQFKFRGQLFLVTNGSWTPDVPWIGSDARRATGLSFDVRFVDNPTGPNEKPKDSGIKENLRNYFAEFWFMVRVFWLVEQPRGKSDHTLPQCPNAIAVTNEILGGQFDKYELDEDFVKKFVEKCLIPYEVSEAKPSSAADVDDAFWAYTRETIPTFTQNEARRVLRQNLQYKTGHSIPKRAMRPKTTVNVYLDAAGKPHSVKPPALFVAA